jgi:hypothetical protein
LILNFLQDSDCSSFRAGRRSLSDQGNWYTGWEYRFLMPSNSWGSTYFATGPTFSIEESCFAYHRRRQCRVAQYICISAATTCVKRKVFILLANVPLILT